MTARPDFTVTLWHGESGSIAYVIGPSLEEVESFSTWQHGAAFRDMAQARADRLNAAWAKS